MSLSNTDFLTNISQTPSSERVLGLTVPAWRRSSFWALILFTLILPFLLEGFTVFQLTLAAVYAIAIIGLVVLTGYTGQFSLGHNVFYALGAYTSAILVEQFEISVYLTIPVSAMVCLIFGFLFGISVTRLAGLYLALSTLALAIATPQIIKHRSVEPWTGGVGGIDLFKPDVPAAVPLEPDQWWYFFVLLFLFLSMWTAKNLIESRSGRAMMAVRDNAIAARSMGINTTRYKAVTFGVSAMYAGVAGSLSAVVIEFCAPDSYTFNLAFLFLTGMVIGGMTSIPGVVFGALFVLLLPNYAEDFSKDLAYAVFGILLILTVYLMPSGAAGFYRSILERVRTGLRSRSPGSSG